ncbi:MAG: hypothetical protein QG641_774, partial [Candidatus Poribacteria bacterium]|nr:hypothetical protein [Candidatus Poribacteria bacterium]
AGLLRYSQRVIEEKTITKDDITEAISEAAMKESVEYWRPYIKE